MPKKPQPKGAVRVFYSYSHKDEKLRDLLETHLALLKRRKVISSWHDRRIGAGDEWAGQIDEHMKSADIILLLVSANFIASKYCYDVEMKLALKRHRAREARVIPIILRPCDLTGVPFGKLQSLPKDRRPVTKWPNRDDAFTDIANGIRLAAGELKAKRRVSSASGGDAATEEAPPLITSKAAASLIPRPPVVGFVARRDKEGRDIVGLLKEELAPDKNQLVALWGPGGSGKTTLAVEVIGATKDSFNRRVVWASSLNRSDFGLATILDEIATQLGREDLRRLAPEPKATQVAALVSESPTLVILDNFETVPEEEQSRCLDFLAQNTTCPVLITTRAFIDRDDVINVELAAMELDEAREFLRRLIARTPKKQNFKNLDHDNLIQKCEANPLLLQWVVRQIVLSKTPQNALDYLSKGEGDAAERVFTRSFNLPQLGDDGRAALLALSLFTPSASREALTEVSGFDTDFRRLDKAVESLTSLWLVETTEGNKRLFLRGLTRELAKSYLSKDARIVEPQRRYIGYFLEYSEAHARSMPEDLNALEDEKDNVLGAMDAAFKAQDWNSVVRIRKVLDAFFNIRGHWDESIRSGEQAGTAAREADNDWDYAAFAINVAIVRRKRGEHVKAAKDYREALEIFKKLKSERNILACLHGLGVIAKVQGNLEEARCLLGESLEIAKKLRDERSMALTIWSLGDIALDQYNFDEAKRLFTESLEVLNSLEDRVNASGVLSQLAIVSQKQGDLEEARRLHRASLEIRNEIGDQHGIAISLGNLGLLAEREGNKTEAVQLLQQALHIFEKLGSPDAAGARIDLVRLTGLMQHRKE